MKRFILPLLLLPVPALAQHHDHNMTADDMTTMGHHVATASEIAANAVLDDLVAQVSKRPPSASTAAIWADIRDASKAKYAEDGKAFARFTNAAKAKLAAPPPVAASLPPDAVLFQTYGRFVELRRKAKIALDPLLYPKNKLRKYTPTTAVKDAIATVAQITAGNTVTPAQMAQATATFDKASTTLEDIIKRPVL